MQIKILAFLFLLSFVACQRGSENSLQPVVEAKLVSLDMAFGQQCRATAPPATTGKIFRSVDGGQTWQDVSAGLPANLAVGGVFASGGEVFLGTEGGLYRSGSSPFSAPVWEQEILLAGRITAVSPGRSGLYACSHRLGLFQKVPGTDMWNLNNALKDQSVRSVLETADGSVFVSTNNGVFKSADAGKSWKQVYAGDMSLDIVESNGVLMFGNQQGVLRSTDGGEHWDFALNAGILAKKTGLLKNRFVTILGTEDASQPNPDGITSRLRVSDDGGKTWHRMEKALLPVQDSYDMDEDLTTALDIFDIVQVGEQLFCSFDTGIYRSADQGKSWELVFPAKTGYYMTVSGQVIYAVPGGGC